MLTSLLVTISIRTINSLKDEMNRQPNSRTIRPIPGKVIDPNTLKPKSSGSNPMTLGIAILLFILLFGLGMFMTAPTERPSRGYVGTVGIGEDCIHPTS